MGSYDVIFDRNVSNCAYVATLGDEDHTNFPGEISAVRRLDNNNGVFVATYTSAGAAADRPFHLVVHC